jgi:hypothetical protein
MIGLEWLRAKAKQKTTVPVEPVPPRDIPWSNAVQTRGACTHDVIYSGCGCPVAE